MSFNFEVVTPDLLLKHLTILKTNEMLAKSLV